MRDNDPQADGLTVAEAAAYVRLHRSTISRLVSSGRIPHRMVGRVPRFSRLALSRWLAGDDAQTAPAAPTTAPTSARPRLTPKHVGRRRATGLDDGSGGASLGVVRGGRM